MTHPYEVRFTKAFTSGPLAGMQIAESIRFADENLAKAFVELSLQHPEITKPSGGSPYRIENPRLDQSGKA